LTSSQKIILKQKKVDSYNFMKKLTMVMFTKMWELFNIGGQTHPWVVPLGTSHSKILKPTQLENNIGPI
jgi:hypothetical protein